MKKAYNLYIQSYSGKTRLYWNILLQSWVEYKGNASPIFEDELYRYDDLISKWNGILIEVKTF